VTERYLIVTRHGATLPVGTVFPSKMPPNGAYAACDGGTLPQQGFPELYAVIGSTYGRAREGRFRLPDFTNRISSPYIVMRSIRSIVGGDTLAERLSVVG